MLHSIDLWSISLETRVLLMIFSSFPCCRHFIAFLAFFTMYTKPLLSTPASTSPLEGLPLMPKTRKVDATLYRGIPGWQLAVTCEGWENETTLDPHIDQQIVQRSFCQLWPVDPGVKRTIVLTIRDPQKNVVFQRSQSIDVFTGTADPQGELANPLTTANIHDSTRGISISYGFFAPPQLSAGDPLATNFQVYLYLTKDHAQWMGEETSFHQKPLRQWPLPGLHDAGTYTSELFGHLTAAKNLAFTQKEPTAGTLRAGARFFDFRPGHSLESFLDEMLLSAAPFIATSTKETPACFGPCTTKMLTHQHSIVDGARLPDFLDQVIRFLIAYPSEIVVINLNEAGVPSWMEANPANDPGLVSWIKAAMEPYGASGLRYSTQVQDTERSYAELIQANIRLFYLYRALPDDETSDSYDAPGPGYGDLPAIPSALIWAANQCQAGIKANTVFQLQGTPTELSGVILDSLLAPGFDNSHLIGSKSWLDARTYPMISGLFKMCQGSGLSLWINDFYDSALTDCLRRAMATKQ